MGQLGFMHDLWSGYPSPVTILILAKIINRTIIDRSLSQFYLFNDKIKII